MSGIARRIAFVLLFMPLGLITVLQVIPVLIIAGVWWVVTGENQEGMLLADWIVWPLAVLERLMPDWK